MPEESIVDRVHDGVHSINPLNKNTSTSSRAPNLTAYKVGTAVSWIVLVITSLVYDFSAPREGRHARRTIWGQNSHNHTPFAMNAVITSLYWLALYIMQCGYTWYLYKGTDEYVTAAVNVGGHFIVHNLLIFGFLHLWCRSHFWLALLLIVINFFNLSAAYFRHPTTPRVIHIATVSGPLAWNFVALFWVGAAAVHAHNLPARIVANIFIWSILGYGLLFLVVFKDYTMGIELSILMAAIGVSQFLTKVIAFQWIFAFVIMGLLFVLSIAVAMPGVIGQDPFKRGEIVNEDRERAPLLDEE
ncbi:DUF1774-domain-containing protein [Aulographum hederae CBS 113979]|uniref:DUF1774-domain-containing protein n=1 Tax=Aulographum hederae CBS 113979 TaxID=1176131 RepID=A0A6G1GQW8_9PEZI|nr:DUF1774-domain-containing protein [Aulographum hederae CBS 113979]